MCPYGTVSLTSGSSTCVPCPAGYACPNATTVVECGAKTYSLNGSTNCTACPEDQICPSVFEPPQVSSYLILIILILYIHL